MSKYTTQTDTLQQDTENNLILFSGELHAFDTQLATIYGIEEAIVIHHFLHWVKINKRLNQNCIEGRTWTYQTQDWIIAHFPYFKNRNKLIRIIDYLVEIGVLIKGNFNKTKFDRTVWYAFKDESKFEQCIVQKRTMDSVEPNNPKCENEPPIPDTKYNSKTYIKESTLTSTKESAPEIQLSFGSHVKLTQHSYDKLVGIHTKPVIDDWIERVNDHIDSKGLKPYKDYSATIRNWIRNDMLKPGKSSYISSNTSKQILSRQKEEWTPKRISSTGKGEEK